MIFIYFGEFPSLMHEFLHFVKLMILMKLLKLLILIIFILRPIIFYEIIIYSHIQFF